MVSAKFFRSERGSSLRAQRSNLVDNAATWLEIAASPYGLLTRNHPRGDSLVRASGGNSKGLEFDVEAELGELGDQPFGFGFR